MPSRPKVPKTIKIGAHDYKVVHIRGLKDDNGNPLNGQLFDDKTLLELESSMRHTKKQEILLHECLHGCFYGMPDPWDVESEERCVGVLAPRLLALLQDNPELVAYLLSKK